VVQHIRVLIVDDDAGIRRFIRRVLEEEGMQSEAAADPDEARRILGETRTPFDAILLDVSLPRQSGWEYLEELREGGDQTPVNFLTAHHAVEERVRGLRLGADDYVVKPFAPAELIARVEAVVRRRQSLPIVTVGDLSIDVARRTVERDGHRVELSPREFGVLAELAIAHGETLSKADLLERVWDIQFDPGTKVVEVQITRLRRKLGRGGHSSLIETVPGRGYRLSGAPPSEG